MTGGATAAPRTGTGPGTDLRLVPAVGAALATAWLVTGPARGASPGPVAGAVLVVLVVLAVLGAVAPACRSRVAGAVGRARGVAAHVVLAGVCVVAVCVGAGVQTARQAPLAGAAADGALAQLSGRVVSEPRPAVFGEGSRWVLAVGTVTARGATTGTTGQVEVTAPGAPPRFGAVVEVTSVLREVPPGDGVLARTTAAAPVAEQEPPGAVLRATHTLRSALLDVTGPLSPQARGLVPGVAVGDTSRLPPDLDDAMRTTSLTHITAVSGGHFAIVVATLTALCALLRAPRWLRVVAVAAVALAFVALVRPEPSVLRAAWTCAFALLGLALGRPSAGLPALAGAATLLLVVDPWLARSYGFVLSCAATAGLVLLAGPLARRLAPWTGRPLAFGLAVPWAAQAACGPVLVLLDPRVPLMSVPANLLAAPALVPATVLGLLATLLAPWAPAVAHAIAWLAGGATAWIAAVARTFAGLPGAGLPWPAGIGGALALALVTGAGLALVLRRPPGDGWPRTWRETVQQGRRSVRRAALRRSLRARGPGARRPRPGTLVAGLASCISGVPIGPRGVPTAICVRSGTVSDPESPGAAAATGATISVAASPANAAVLVNRFMEHNANLPAPIPHHLRLAGPTFRCPPGCAYSVPMTSYTSFCIPLAYVSDSRTRRRVAFFSSSENSRFPAPRRTGNTSR